jgi:hypothetical protein
VDRPDDGGEIMKIYGHGGEEGIAGGGRGRPHDEYMGEGNRGERADDEAPQAEPGGG